MGDRVQLQQVFLNLIMNACEAMRETSTHERLLTVTTQEGKGSEVEVIFADSGPGIADDMVEQLFEPFATTKPQGLGLGLSISRAIVAAHNGHLRARNGNGGGAILSVRLPAEG
jgi:two-component system sensor kinase FixL